MQCVFSWVLLLGCVFYVFVPAQVQNEFEYQNQQPNVKIKLQNKANIKSRNAASHVKPLFFRLTGER